MKIAVFCPNLIGDTVMATPAFRAFRHGFPDATIAGVIKPRRRPHSRRHALVRRRLISARFPGIATQSIGRPLSSAGCAAARFDLAVLLPNSFRSAVDGLAWRASRGGSAMLATAADVLLDRPSAPSATHRDDGSDPDRGILPRSWRGGSAVRSIRFGPSWPRPADDEIAADRAWSAPLACDRGSRRLPEYRRGVWPGEELAGRALSPTWRGAWLVEAGVAVAGAVRARRARGRSRRSSRPAGHPRVVSLAGQTAGRRPDQSVCSRGRRS